MASAASSQEALHPGRWWHRDGLRYRCDLCPRACLLSPGQRGFCFVRVGTDRGIALSSYARSSGFCIDPVEKKPLHHFFPGSSVFSLGTAGCNLGCRFCQNWDISAARDWDRLTDHATPAEIARVASALSCESVAFTYNDPVIFAEYAIDAARECRERGIHPIAVTNGYISPGARQEFFASMDAANIDLKSFSDDFYRKFCLARLAPILETIEYVATRTDVWLELTTLLIPGLNDADCEVEALARWVMNALGPDVPLHFSAFHPAHKMLDRPPTPLATLKRARRIALNEGLHFVYAGNVRDEVGESTWCPRCKARLIERDFAEIRSYALDAEGRCKRCGERVPGHFAERAGRWGNRSLRVFVPEQLARLDAQVCAGGIR